MYDLNTLKSMVETAVDLTSRARELSERDRDYYDNHQWTAEEVAVLNQRKQPVITINRIQRKVDALVGIEQRMRTDPKALPRSPQHEKSAEAATKALVFVDDNTMFDKKRSMVFENACVEGYGGVEVIVEQRRGQMEIVINRLRWEEIVADPHSREKDFSDAAFLGSQKWMTIDKAKAFLSSVWDGEEDELDAMLDSAMKNPQDGETYEDRPFETNAFRWADRRQKRVRIAQIYYLKDNTWHLSIFCGGGEIYNAVSPYYDEDGRPCCPIELMTAYIDRENQRYGLVRSMISLQDEINKRRSKLLHFNNARQTVGVKGAVDSVASLKRELASPDGHVELNIEQFEDAARAGVRPFEVLGTGDQVSGQFALYQESKSEIDMFGPNPSLIGQTEQGASGRAIMAQQQAGMAELAPLYDSLRDWTIRVYRAMWARIRQFWQEPRWVRIADYAGNNEWLTFNEPVGFTEVSDMQTGQMQIVPQMRNAVAEMDVDIVIDDVPDHVTLQQEQFEQLAQMASNGIPIPPEMLIKASSVQDKGEILEMMQQQRQEAMQAEMQRQQAEMQLEAMKVQSGGMRDMANAEKARAETAETVADTRRTNIETAQIASGLR